MYSLHCRRITPSGSKVGDGDTDNVIDEPTAVSVIVGGGSQTRIRSTTPPTVAQTMTVSSWITIDDNDKYVVQTNAHLTRATALGTASQFVLTAP